MLAALAVAAPKALSSDQLALILWGDDVPASASKVVQGIVMRLRRALGRQHIETTSAGYRLAGGELDIDEFEALVVRGREQLIAGDGRRAVALFEQALSLWRGPPLAELSDWPPAQTEAARLGEIHDAAEEELVESLLLAGRTKDAVAASRQLVSTATEREHRWALFARSLYRAGRQREALDVIRRARMTLREELGLDPGPELSTLEHAILTHDATLGGLQEAAQVSEVCPYPGLRPFDVDQADLFVGREAEIDQAVRRVQEQSLLVVLGASGSGKSSLVRAGIVPALARTGRTAVVLTPGADPNAALSAALTKGDAHSPVVVDQLEEAFAGPDIASSVEFLRQLSRLLRAGRTVVVTLRADQAGALSLEPEFAQHAERSMLLLAPMSEDSLRRAVEEPARRSGLRFEPGLIDLLIEEVRGEPGGLPLLGHALAETWTRREGDMLTVAGYRSTGGINGAVAQSAERLYASMDDAGRHMLRSVLNRLVVIAPGGEAVPARAPDRVFTTSTGAARALSALVTARLVTADADTVVVAHECLFRAWPRLSAWLDEDADGQRISTHLQIATDGWERANRPDDELYRGARLQAALEWREREQPLLSEPEEQFLQASLTHERDEQRARVVELRGQRTKNRQLRWALSAVVLLLALALAGGSTAAMYGQRATRDAAAAERSAADSLSQRLASASLTEPRLDTALLLARQGVATSNLPSLQGNLLNVLVKRNVLTSATLGGVVRAQGLDTAVTVDGRRALVLMVQGGPDPAAESLVLVDPETAEVVKVLAEPPGEGGGTPWPSGFVDHDRTAAFSRDAPAGSVGEKELVLVDPRTGALHGEPQPIPGSVKGDWASEDRLRITPDGRTLTSVDGHAVRVWHLTRQGWRGPQQIPIPSYPLAALGMWFADGTRFSSDSRYAAFVIEYLGRATVGPPRVGYLLDLRTGKFTKTGIPVPADIQFSPDGKLLAIASQDGDVVIEPLGSGPDPVTIPGAGPTTLAFSEDGRRLGIGYKDGSAAAYTLNPLHGILSVPASGTQIIKVAVPDGVPRLLTLDFESRLTTYSLTGASSVIGTAPTPPVTRVSAGPTGTVVAAGFDDGRVALFDQGTLRRLRNLWLGPYPKPDRTFDPQRHRRVTALAVTPDGKAVIAADRVGHLRMWSTADGRQLWSRDDIPASYLAVSPDGRYLATSEYTQDFAGDPGAADPDWLPVTTTLRIWDLRHPGTVLFSDSLGDFTDGSGHTPKPRALVFSPDSSMVAAAWFLSVDLLVVYDVHTGHRILTRPPKDGEDPTVDALTFTPDSTQLVMSGSDGAVTTRTPSTGQGALLLRTGSGSSTALAFSGDGRLLLTGPSPLSIWDARTRAPIVVKLPFKTSSYDGSMVTTQDGQVFIGTADGIARLDLDPSHWNRVACDLAARTLTQDEWSAYFGDAVYRPACS